VNYNDLIKTREVIMATLSTLPCYQKTQNLPDLYRLWLLRMLVPLGAHRCWLTEHGINDDNIALALGLEHWLDDPFKDFDRKVRLKELRQLHAEFETASISREVPEILAKNVAHLARILNLEPAECRVLEFAIVLHDCSILGEVEFPNRSTGSAYLIFKIATILDLPEHVVREVVHFNGRLASTGLLKVDPHAFRNNLQDAMGLLNDRFPYRMTCAEADPAQLFAESFSQLPAPVLGCEDFRHIETLREVLIGHFRLALEKRSPGVNAFIYGPPGTGKSQLARVVAMALDTQLYEVSSQDEGGEPHTPVDRLCACNIAQIVLSKETNLLVFDEAEDVLVTPDSNIMGRSNSPVNKAWLNQLLEQNAVPCIWISNQHYGIDPAFLRRFDIVIHLDVPPERRRREIIESECGQLLTEEMTRRLTATANLAPAIVTRATDVVRGLAQDMSEDETSTAIGLLIENTHQAQGHAPLSAMGPPELPAFYTPGYINCPTDLLAMAEALKANPVARMCLYGPPVTGKTAYGQWLAKHLNLPVLIKRGSDLISPFVGMTEKRIAETFQRAAREGVVLIMDEVDTFLQDRRNARYGWEVSEVNEMLTQMECYKGVMIATTNLMDGLDQAALRRFDLKLRFDYLQPEQAWSLFRHHAEQLGLTEPDPQIRRSVRKLEVLTPGDFSAVSRKAQFLAPANPGDLLNMLVAECEMKEDGRRRPIGFA